MQPQLDRIRDKLARLTLLDADLDLFGAEKHQYRLNPVLDKSVIQAFEEKHGVILPPGYKLFLTTIGNGGAGPFYGLEPFEHGLFADLDYRRPDDLLNPSSPFSHTEHWNMDFTATVSEEEDLDEYERQYETFSDEYFAKNHLDGALAICNYGCAISLNLVVNGPEYGHIWTDDRGSDVGIYPSCELDNEGRIGFLDWYELWLDKSLAELKDNQLADTPANSGIAAFVRRLAGLRFRR